MTDFSAGDPSNTAGDVTNFSANGVPEPNLEPKDDSPVVFEFEGRKFTAGALVKKLTHADTHISRLEQKLDEQAKLLETAAEQLKKTVGVQEMLQKLNQGQKPPEPPVVNEPPTTGSPDEIAAQVIGKLKEREVAQQKERNWADVRTKLTAVYGEKVNQKVSEVAARSGLTLEAAAELARNTPAVFLALFPELSTQKAKTSVLPERGRVNSQSFTASTSGSSGYGQARTTKQQVEIYLNKLRQLSAAE